MLISVISATSWMIRCAFVLVVHYLMFQDVALVYYSDSNFWAVQYGKWALASDEFNFVLAVTFVLLVIVILWQFTHHEKFATVFTKVRSNMCSTAQNWLFEKRNILAFIVFNCYIMFLKTSSFMESVFLATFGTRCCETNTTSGILTAVIWQHSTYECVELVLNLNVLSVYALGHNV